MILDTIMSNMGTSLEIYVLIVIVLGSLIFMVKDMRLGLLFLFFMLATTLLIFKAFSRDITYYIYALMISFILVSLSLFIDRTGGGAI